MVEFIVAIDEARVRFTDDALLSFFVRFSCYAAQVSYRLVLCFAFLKIDVQAA